jgi:hypothetical protein
MSSYRALETLWRAPHPPGERPVASTAVLWEVPGTLCQLAAIQRIADVATMQRFADWLFEHGPPLYRQGLEILEAVSPHQSGNLHSRGALALTAWSQMGRFKTETSTSAPAWRLLRLRDARQRGLRWTGEEPFLDLIARWDEAVGRSSLTDLEDSTRELSGSCRCSSVAMLGRRRRRRTREVNRTVLATGTAAPDLRAALALSPGPACGR